LLNNGPNDDEIARVQVGDMHIHQSYAGVISEVNHCVVTTIRRLEQGSRLAGLRII
jgi:hypothetical protein